MTIPADFSFYLCLGGFILLVITSGYVGGRVTVIPEPLRQAGLTSRQRADIRHNIRRGQVPELESERVLALDRAEWFAIVGRWQILGTPFLYLSLALVLCGLYLIPAPPVTVIVIVVQGVILLWGLRLTLLFRSTLRKSREYLAAHAVPPLP